MTSQLFAAFDDQLKKIVNSFGINRKEDVPSQIYDSVTANTMGRQMETKFHERVFWLFF